jgi:hypothetical protein
MVRVTENRLEPAGKEKGLFNYLWDQVNHFQFRQRYQQEINYIKIKILES